MLTLLTLMTLLRVLSELVVAWRELLCVILMDRCWLCVAAECDADGVSMMVCV